ncbi:MAG: hypothetical protein NT029_10000 [Armatimonadetes bacterium]|nr:hypothetical protein [Armatimonadota bacterium]
MRLRSLAWSAGLMLAASVAYGQTPDAAAGAGLGAFLGACFVGGLASLLTPCVFPMIPVTVSYFSKRTDGSAMPAAIAYALGIASTFAVLGILAAVLFGATGISNFAANPWVNLALGVLFVALAFNLFGLLRRRSWPRRRAAACSTPRWAWRPMARPSRCPSSCSPSSRAPSRGCRSRATGWPRSSRCWPSSNWRRR